MVVAIAQHQHLPGIAREQVGRRRGAFVFRRQREVGGVVRRRGVAAVERQQRHGLRGVEQAGHLVAAQRADDLVGALGQRALARADRARRRAASVVEHQLRLLAALGVVAGQQPVAHRRGGRGQFAAHGQQHRQLARRAVAVAVARGARGIEVPVRIDRRRRGRFALRDRSGDAHRGAAGQRRRHGRAQHPFRHLPHLRAPRVDNSPRF